MKTRMQLTLGLAALMAASVPVSAAPEDTPAQVVQQYLTDRDAHKMADAYALLSPATRQQFPQKEFTAHHDVPNAPGLTPMMRALLALFSDTGAYRFQVTGAAPDDKNVVLVSAQPSGADAKDVLTLKVVTVADAGDGGKPRVDAMLSLERTDSAAFHKARDAAQAAVSASNLKQIALAIVKYANAHNNRLPDADRWVDEVSSSWKDPKADPAEQERQFQSLFHDPSAPPEQAWSYAFNRDLSGRSLTSVLNPAGTVLVFESTAGVKNAADGGVSVPHPGRHNGGTHFAFADGHVQWFADSPAPQTPKPTQ